MPSDTPRTDALVEEGGLVYDADFARQLERELNAAKAQLVSKTDELAAAIRQRDEAHGLIRKWRLNLVEVVDNGEIMYAMTSDGRCSMNDADKRAFLEATRKEGGRA